MRDGVVLQRIGFVAGQGRKAAFRHLQHIRAEKSAGDATQCADEHPTQAVPRRTVLPRLIAGNPRALQRDGEDAGHTLRIRQRDRHILPRNAALVPALQRLRGESGFGIRVCGGMERQGYFASAGRVAHRVVQQIAHRPVKADAVHRHDARRHIAASKGNLLCGAKATAGALPAFRQLPYLHRFIRPFALRPGGGHRPQLRHVVFQPLRTPEDGLDILPLGGGERILRQKFRIAADDADASRIPAASGEPADENS